MKMNRTDLKLREISAYMLAAVFAGGCYFAIHLGPIDRTFVAGLAEGFLYPYAFLLIGTGFCYFSRSDRVAYLTFGLSIVVLVLTVAGYTYLLVFAECGRSCWPFVLVPSYMMVGVLLYLVIGVFALTIFKPKLRLP
jgi:hypothetical protein